MVQRRTSHAAKSPRLSSLPLCPLGCDNNALRWLLLFGLVQPMSESSASHSSAVSLNHQGRSHRAALILPAQACLVPSSIEERPIHPSAEVRGLVFLVLCNVSWIPLANYQPGNNCSHPFGNRR